MPRARGRLASTAPRTPRIVTTRTPLFDEAGWREDGADLGEMRSGIFSRRNLDDPNQVEMADEIRSLAQHFSWVGLASRPSGDPKGDAFIGDRTTAYEAHVSASRAPAHFSEIARNPDDADIPRLTRMTQADMASQQRRPPDGRHCALRS
jgi:hypothetical protein